MTDTLAFSGSEVAAIHQEGGDVVVRLSAGRLLPSGDHLPVTLTLQDVSHSDHGADCIGTLAEGEVEQTTGRIKVLPLALAGAGEPQPNALTGALRLTLAFANGATCCITAHALRVTPGPAHRRHTWLSC